MGQIEKVPANGWFGSKEKTIYRIKQKEKPYCGFRPKHPHRITQKDYVDLCRKKSETIMRGYIDTGHYVIVDDPADFMK